MQNGNSPWFKLFLQKPWVKLIIAVDIIAIMVVICAIINNATKTCTLNFAIAPVDATISVNGNDNYQNGSYQIHPGKYNITISKEGLVSKFFSIELEPGYNASITTFLVGEDGDLSFYELKDNYVSYVQLVSIASESNNITTDDDTTAESFIAKTQKIQNLLQENLPIDYTEYQERPGDKSELVADITIRYSQSNNNCQKFFCVQALMALTDDKAKVIQLLKDKNLNPEDFEIEYKIYQ